MFRPKYILLYFKLLLLSMLLVSLSACSDDKGETEEYWDRVSVSFMRETVGGTTQNNRLKIETPRRISYKAALMSDGDWCSFAPREKQLGKEGVAPDDLFVYFDANKSGDARQVVVRVELANSKIYEARFTQEPYTAESAYNREWGEQPAKTDNPDYVYKTYFTDLSKPAVRVRNYSICYDTKRHVSHWVAYPLHHIYVSPSVHRTDRWAYDPNNQMPVIPESQQQYIIESYKTGYVRGHQIASADRYNNTATNEMTFYATNMMPQDYDFNGGIWATLESKVRANIVSDTLFVVTGTYFADGRTMRDRKGTVIAIPSHCWKVLLRTKSGTTRKAVRNCTADELQGIGFWFENKSYSNSSSLLKEHAVSISEIEKRTGFSFFRELNDEVARKVKAQKNPSAWQIH